MMSPQRVSLNVELVEDRVLPAAFFLREYSPSPPAPVSSSPVIVRGPEGEFGADAPVRRAIVITEPATPDRNIRPADFTEGMGKVALSTFAMSGPSPFTPSVRPAVNPTEGPVALSAAKLPDSFERGMWAPLANWAVDLGRGNPGLPTPWRPDTPSPGLAPDTPFREELAERTALAPPLGPGLALFTRFTQPAEGPFEGSGWNTQAEMPIATAVNPTVATALSAFQIISVPSGMLVFGGQSWLSPGAMASLGSADRPDSADPGSTVTPDQDRSTEPPPSGEDVVPVKADVPGGSPLAGLLGLDTVRLEAGARRVLACVSDLGVELTEELDTPAELG